MSAPKPKKRVLLTLCAVLLAVTALCAVYLGTYYHADTAAIEAFAEGSSVSVTTAEDGTMIFAPTQADTGLIFYPGGKVEYTAYIPLMQACAENGCLCILIPMPCNLAVLDVNAAEGIPDQFPHIENWYIGGHSLGGSMAAAHLADNADTYAGLILLGSYSTADFSASDLNILSVYGSEDMVLNADKYEEYRGNLPEDTTEVIIEGGCHAYFGMYGAQKGDGTPTISNEAQIQITATEFIDFIHR